MLIKLTIQCFFILILTSLKMHKGITRFYFNLANLVIDTDKMFQVENELFLYASSSMTNKNLLMKSKVMPLNKGGNC
jgi:hypothetical protein